MLEEDAPALQKLAKECKDYREVQRLRALYALSLGNSVTHVSAIFDVNDSTVYEWIAWWRSHRGLSDEPRSGRPHAFSDEERDELKHLIKENDPRKHGVNASAWDCAELVKFFTKNGFAVSDETVRVELRALGAHYVKAIIEYAEADLKAQHSFALQTLRSLAHRGNAAVLFQDEMSAETSPRKGYGWTLEKRLVVKAVQSHAERLNVFGASSPFTGEVFELASSCAKASAFIKFLNKIVTAHPRKRVWLYLDNLPVHKSWKVKRFLKRHSNIRVDYLPPYSPELNPREQWHNYLRKKLLNNNSFSSTLSLAKAIHAFARATPRSVVRSVCSLTPIYTAAAKS